MRVFVALAIGVAAAISAPSATRAAEPEPGGVVSMAAFKCLEFLALQETNPEAAAAMVRWIDGWHAAGAGNALFTETDYEKHVDAATSACYHYPKRSLMKVMAGKFR
jgi:hypothetical protein